MYRNLNAEKARKGYSWREVSDRSGIAYQTLMHKVSSGGEFTLKQAYSIKAALGVDMPYEELFKWEE